MDRQGRLEPRRSCLGSISTSVADADFRSRTRTHGTPNNPLLRVGDKGHRRSCCSHMAHCKGNLCDGSEDRPSLGSHRKGNALVSVVLLDRAAWRLVELIVPMITHALTSHTRTEQCPVWVDSGPSKRAAALSYMAHIQGWSGFSSRPMYPRVSPLCAR